MLLYYLILLLLCYLWIQRRKYLLHWKISGPIGLPFLGSVLDLRNSERTFNFFKKLKDKYNSKSPLGLWLGHRCCVIVSDPDTAEIVFTSPNCVNKSFVYNFLRDIIGDGLFTSLNPKWYTRKKIMNPVFHKKVLSNFMSVFNEKTDNFIETIKNNLNSEKLDVQACLRELSLDVACKTTLGGQLETGSSGLMSSYLNVMHLVVKRMFKPWFYNFQIYKLTPEYKQCMKSANNVIRFVDKLIRHRLHDKVTIDDSRYLVDQLLDNYEANGLTLIDVRDEVNVMMAAAFETTSNALHLVVMCLAMYPEYQEKLFEELYQVFPNPDFEVTDSDLKNLNYCEMAMNEAMRFISPVPIVGRTNTIDINLKNGVIIPKGTEILIDIFNMQRNSKYWGEKSETFYPDHFAAENLKTIHPYAFIPFTKGTRMCIGFQYSMKFMKVAISKLFRKYKISTDWKMSDIVIRGDVSIQFKEYPTYKIEKRLF